MEITEHQTLALCHHGIPVKFACAKCNFDDAITKRVENLEGYMEMEDRITASTIINTIDQLSKQIVELEKRIEKMEEIIKLINAIM